MTETPTAVQHTPHPRVDARALAGPAKVNDQHPRRTAVDRFNAAIAVKITDAVGSMWCAYVFTAIALVGLPEALKQGTLGIVQWVAQTFLQLVLLSIIMVGQNVQAGAADKRAQDTYEDAEAVLHEALHIQAHLLEQDRVLAELTAALRAREGGAAPRNAASAPRQGTPAKAAPAARRQGATGATAAPASRRTGAKPAVPAAKATRTRRTGQA